MKTEFDVWVKYSEARCKEMRLTFGEWYPRNLNTVDFDEAAALKKQIDEYPQATCVIESKIVCRAIGDWCECSNQGQIERKGL